MNSIRLSVLVGEGRMGAAAHLAEDLGLPFPLIADNEHFLWRHYAANSLNVLESRAGLILVDGSGRQLYSRPLQSPQQRLDPAALLATLEDLATGWPGYTSCGSQEAQRGLAC